MKRVIVTTSPGFGKIGSVPDEITKRDWKFIRCDDASLPDGGTSRYVNEMEILVTGLIQASAELINNAKNLKAILKHGVGVDNIDIAAATAMKIPVINAPGTNANAVAELAVGSMFSLVRQIPMVHNKVVSGDWIRYVGTEISGKTLGIVGLGNIGKQLALKARALGMTVVASDVYQDKEFSEKNHVKYVALDELLRCSDFVSLHLFGGEQNKNLIGAKEIASMKSTAYIMNFARGDILDLDALSTALDQEKIKGAAIDAYVHEPPDREHPIFSNSQVVFTPHSGADTTESVERMGLMNITDIDLILEGKRSRRVLNPEIYD